MNLISFNYSFIERFQCIRERMAERESESFLMVAFSIEILNWKIDFDRLADVLYIWWSHWRLNIEQQLLPSHYWTRRHIIYFSRNSPEKSHEIQYCFMEFVRKISLSAQSKRKHINSNYCETKNEHKSAWANSTDLDLYKRKKRERKREPLTHSVRFVGIYSEYKNVW